MIIHKIKNGIEAKSDIQESKETTGIKEGKNTRIDRGKLQTSREAYKLIEHLNNRIMHPIFRRVNPRSSGSNPMNV